MAGAFRQGGGVEAQLWVCWTMRSPRWPTPGQFNSRTLNFGSDGAATEGGGGGHHSGGGEPMLLLNCINIFRNKLKLYLCKILSRLGYR